MASILYVEHADQVFVACASDGIPIIFAQSGAGIEWFLANAYRFDYGKSEDAVAILTLMRLGRVNSFGVQGAYEPLEILQGLKAVRAGAEGSSYVQLKLAQGERTPKELLIDAVNDVVDRGKAFLGGLLERVTG